MSNGTLPPTVRDGAAGGVQLQDQAQQESLSATRGVNQTTLSRAIAELPNDELGKFGRWWTRIFGRPRHSVTLDALEKQLRTEVDPIKQRMGYLIRLLSMTSGARFETARRHKKKYRTSTISILILSLYAMLFSMMTTLNAFNPQQKELLSMLSIFMSSFIIGFTLYESSKRYDARAESFLRCATELQKIRDEAATKLATQSITLVDVDKCQAQYHKVLSDYTDNHAVLDYRAHQISTGKIVGPKAVGFQILILFNIWLIPLIAIVSPGVLFLLYKVVRYYALATAANG